MPGTARSTLGWGFGREPELVSPGQIASVEPVEATITGGWRDHVVGTDRADRSRPSDPNCQPKLGQVVPLRHDRAIPVGLALDSGV